jgi:molybdate transport system ATP-binding protein
VRRDLGRYLAQFDGSTVLVTHDPVDALALADEVVVLDAGQVIQTGSIDELSSRPRSSYVARLIGTNLVRGRGDGHQLTLDDGLALTLADPVEGPSFAVIPPAAVSLHRARPEGSARNRWPMVVEGLDRLGDRVRVRLTGPVPLVAEVTPAAVADLALVDGATVWAAVKATEITAYPV